MAIRRKIIPEFAGRAPLKKKLSEIKKDKKYDLLSPTIGNNRSPKISSSTFNYILFKNRGPGKYISDYIAANPKALRLRYNKQLRIFVERYGNFASKTFLKNLEIMRIFKELPVGAKIYVMDTILCYGDFSKAVKKDPVSCMDSLIDTVKSKSNEYMKYDVWKELQYKYKDNPDKMISELKRILRDTHSDPKHKHILSELQESSAFSYYLRLISKEKAIDILSRIYWNNGVDSAISGREIHDYFNDVKIKNSDGSFNN